MSFPDFPGCVTAGFDLDDAQRMAEETLALYLEGLKRGPAHTLSDFLAAPLPIECEPCSRRGRYNVAKLMQQYGDKKLPSSFTCSQIALGRDQSASSADARRVRQR